MAVKKKAVRRKKPTRGRKVASVVKMFRSNRWTSTPGLAAAVALTALVGVLLIAYSASPPLPATEATEATTAAPSQEHPEPAAAPSRAVASTATASRPRETAEAPADDAEPSTGVTTGPMPMVVTLTGCLARSDNAFRLNDTTGVNVPKARSWKSGFLTKRSASIAIVPDSSELPLAKHIGSRVTLSGTLIDREMRVRTLRRVSSSCGTGEDDTRRVTA
jgi:hypothetical protein